MGWIEDWKALFLDIPPISLFFLANTNQVCHKSARCLTTWSGPLQEITKIKILVSILRDLKGD